MAFLKEADFRHDSQRFIGVLLVNLGTPDAPTPKAVKRYLAEFLSDRRVVEIPRLIWWFILHGIILQTRPKKSAAKYASIWTKEGSPLRVWTEQQTKLLKGYLGEHAPHTYQVDMAMRYGQPSIASAIAKLKAAGCDKLLVIPLYPQYAASTTGSVIDEICRVLTRTRNIPALRTVKSFHDEKNYIAALAASVREHWRKAGRGDHLLMSFHGAPQYTLEKGDPYFCHCQKTARLLAEALALGKQAYSISFQSRFGRAKWFEPSTEHTLQTLATQSIAKLDVICPGFVADCLETLEEIAIEGKAIYQSHGGKEYRYIPCLNANEDWINTLSTLTLRETQDWQGDAINTAYHRLTEKQTFEHAFSLGAQK